MAKAGRKNKDRRRWNGLQKSEPRTSGTTQPLPIGQAPGDAAILKARRREKARAAQEAKAAAEAAAFKATMDAIMGRVANIKLPHG